MVLERTFCMETVSDFDFLVEADTPRPIDVYYTNKDYLIFLRMLEGIDKEWSREEYAKLVVQAYCQKVAAEKSGKWLPLIDRALNRKSCLIQAHGLYDQGAWVADIDNRFVRVYDIVNEALTEYELVLLSVCNERKRDLRVTEKGEVIYSRGILGVGDSFTLDHYVQ